MAKTQQCMVCSNWSVFFSFPRLPWSLLLVVYAPIGLLLTLLRVCMSLQAMLILLIFPEGALKRSTALSDYIYACMRLLLVTILILYTAGFC